MNKNPERPKNIDEIITTIINPKKKEIPNYKKAEQEVLLEVFGE